MENNNYEYRYDYQDDILLKRPIGSDSRWFYIMNSSTTEPVYNDYEFSIFKREKKLYIEAIEEQAIKEYELQSDPDYQQILIEQYQNWLEAERNYHGIKTESDIELIDSNNDSNFPVDALPYAVKEIVEEGEKAFDVNHEFFALPALVACATAIGSKFEVALNNTLSTKPIIYACLIAMPGTGKSPAQNIAMKPLKKLQKEAEKQFYKELEKYDIDIENYESEKRKVKKENKEITEEAPKKPRLKEYYTTNSTIEAIAKILKRNPDGIVYINDEFLAFYNSLNGYRSGKGSDLQEWLSLWNGNELKINRKGEDIPLTVNNPFVSIVGNMTPSGIREIAKDSNTENGFLDRFLFSFPTDVKPFLISDTGINEGVEGNYHNLIKSLLEINSNKENKYIRLSKEAMESYINYCKQTNELAGEDEKLRSIVAKLQMYSVRFALIIHLCEKQNPKQFIKPSTIQEDSMHRAIQLCEYFRIQADKIYDKLAISESDELVERAVKVIKKKAKQINENYIIKKRDIQRGIKALKADQMEQLAIDLIEREILEVKEEGKRGSVTYQINPTIFD